MPSLKLAAKQPTYSSYAEVSQTSPMRWRVYLANKNGVLTAQSNWWKCKDFLNDTVFFLETGYAFSIYGYNGGYQVNDKIVYVGVKNIPENVPFLDNLKVLNAFLKDQEMPEVEVYTVEGVQYMLGIPRMYFENTFYISAITSLIRGCVYAPVSTIQDIMSIEPTTKSVKYQTSIKKWLTPKTREKFREILYLNYQYHGKEFQGEYAIHNAGLQSWTNSPMSAEF